MLAAILILGLQLTFFSLPLLHRAIEHEHGQVEQLMLIGQGLTLPNSIAHSGHAGIVEMFIVEYANTNRNDGSTPLHYAAMKGLSGVAKALMVEYGMDANAKNNKERTPLHYAVREGHIEVVMVLMAECADANAGDEQYLTPLHFAAWKGH